MTYALVLACDMAPCGTRLGPTTIIRLEHAREFARRTGAHLVVAAGHSPRHPAQKKTMGQMMAEWLKEREVEATVLSAPIFNTRGELQAFFDLGPEARCVMSDTLHLTRVRILVRRLRGGRWADAIEYIPTNTLAMTKRGVRLEPLKRAFVRFCPFWLQDGVMWLLHRTPLRWINLSY